LLYNKNLKMLFYNFYSKLVFKIIRLIKNKDFQKARKQYFKLKNLLVIELISLVSLLQKLEKENKLSSSVCEAIINELLMPFVSDFNRLFNDVKVIKNYEPSFKEGKIKKIISNLNLDKDKEILFFENFNEIILDIEWFLEATSSNNKNLISKNLNDILKEIKNINKIKIEGKGELMHF